MGIFITGTDTDIGKTYVSALIAKKLYKLGINVAYFKAAMSGNLRTKCGDLIPGDATFVKKFSGINQPIDEMCPYIYEAAVSPHLASKLEDKPIDLDCVSLAYNFILNKYDFVVFEGSGGIVCPIRYDEKKIFLTDIIKLSGLQCIIVSDAKLGSINKVVLTVEYMKLYNIPILGFVFNNFNEKNAMEVDNKKMCEVLTNIDTIAIVRAGDQNIDVTLENLL